MDSNDIVVTKWESLYHIDKLNRVRTWTIEADNRASVTIYHGIQNGKQQMDRREDMPYPKNHEWAHSRWLHKRDREHYCTVFPGRGDKNFQTQNQDKPPRPMLAKTFDPTKSASRQHLCFPAYVQPKIDGVRCIAVWSHDGKIMLFSRTGWLLDSHHLDGVRQELQKIWTRCNWCLDGELFHPDLGFDELSGICRSSKSLSDETMIPRPTVQYHVFDAIDLTDAQKIFHDRLSYIGSVIRMESDSSLVRLIPTHEIHSVDQIMTQHQEFVLQKYEGIIIRNRNGRYQSGYRSWDLQKYKSFYETEFIISGVATGEGREKGAVIWECCTPTGKTFRVRPCGSYEDRRALSENAASYIGRPLTVSYQELTEEGIPRFPIGKGIRLL